VSCGSSCVESPASVGTTKGVKNVVTETKSVGTTKSVVTETKSLATTKIEMRNKPGQ
jgi:hypothetical protein